jgi:glycosyltransferase involved in cell wall biosynthesis
MYGGELEYEIKSLEHVKYFNLEKKGRYDINSFFKYQKLLKKINPDIIYSWMGEMNLFSLWAKPKQTKIVWGIRSSNMDFSQYGKFNLFVYKLQKFFSNRVDKFIFNSYSAVEFYKKEGFGIKNYSVIYNGIDTNRFKRFSYPDKLTIGIVARIDKMKGYIIFAKAIREILKKYDIEVVAIGDGDKNIKNEVLKVEPKIKFLGKMKNIENGYNKLNILVSSSFSEGFSNSIAEAMSCECACVVTDVGDSKKIVGDVGIVVKPNSVESLVKGIEEMINNDYIRMGKKSRKRIIENFSIEKMVKNTIKELECVE